MYNQDKIEQWFKDINVAILHKTNPDIFIWNIHGQLDIDKATGARDILLGLEIRIIKKHY